MGLGSIYINLEGREGQGIVSQARYAETAGEIRERLLRLVDPESGAQVFKGVYPRDDIYRGVCTGTAPDLVLGFADGFRMSWQTAIGGTPLGLIDDNVSRWTGDHCVDPSFVPGIIFVNKRLKTRTTAIIMPWAT